MWVRTTWPWFVQAHSPSAWIAGGEIDLFRCESELMYLLNLRLVARRSHKVRQWRLFERISRRSTTAMAHLWRS